MSEVAVEVNDGRNSFDAWLPTRTSQGSRPLSPSVVQTTAQHTESLGILINSLQSDLGLSATTAPGYLNTRTNLLMPVDSMTGVLDLLHGDQLLAMGSTRSGDAVARVEILNGPLAGQSVSLNVGVHDVGRAEGCSVVLSGPSISRLHARITITAKTELSVVDLGSANGSFVNGTRVGQESQKFASGSVVTIGETVLAIYSLTKLPAHLTRLAHTLQCNRPPRVQPADPHRTFNYPRAPQTANKRPFPVVTLIVPLVVAGAMALLVNPLYLFLGLASPALMIGSLFEDRRTGRKNNRSETARWREVCAQLHAEVRAAHEDAHFARRLRHPGSAVSAARVIARTTDVWQNRPSHSDFLQTAIGTGNLESVVSVSVPDEGDELLRAEAAAVAEQVQTDHDVPLVLALAKLGTIGIVGNEDERADVVNGQVMQLISAHTPQDLQLMVLSPLRAGAWDWCKWLPHALVDGELAIASSEGQSDALFHSLLELAEARVEARSSSLGSISSLPHVVLIIEPPIPIAPRDAARLCEIAIDASITVFWLAGQVEQLPVSTRAIVRCPTTLDSSRTLGAPASAIPRSARPMEEMRSTSEIGRTASIGSVVFPESGARFEVLLDTMTEPLARRSARALSPWRNVNSADDRTGVPTKIALNELLNPEPSTPEAIISHWKRAGFGVSAIVGRGLRGPVSIDMRADGPHALVAGTTGAGKSELLQAWVASLAALHPPTRMTFVLIDYKGGAAFKDCVQLPHTVGYVTDLDPQGGTRAMVSLNAEITRREHILAKHAAKDLMELERKHPDDAPPVLVLIVDEFAALKSELPDFVNGLIDIAQRGRSLGIHLVLATQKPGGVVDPKIQANTNLRIALRMANSNESQDVLGRPLAAAISRRTPGRAFVRIGETQLFEMQTAYVGANAKGNNEIGGGENERPRLFSSRSPLRAMPTHIAIGSRSELQVLVASCRAAQSLLQLPEPLKPWLPILPAVVRVGSLAVTQSNVPGLGVAIGLADEPATQRQFPFVLDLANEGNVAIFGGPGVGKTTLLRTIAMQLCERFTPDRLHLYALDFASRGLLPLEKLPHCGGVVTSDQLDRVRRLIDLAAYEVLTRQEQLAEVGAGSIAELERATGTVVAAMVILIDGFSQFWQTVEPIDRSEYVQKLLRVAAEGRSVGVHLVYTADRRSAVVPALSSVTGARFVMQIPATEEYAALGFPHLSRLGAVLPLGRVAVRDGLEFQTALIGNLGEDGVAQAEYINRRADELTGTFTRPTVPPVRELPLRITHQEVSELLTQQKKPSTAVFAIDDQRRLPALIDFSVNPLFFVVGPDQSGRSTTLATIAKAVARSTPDLTTHFVSVRRNALGEANHWTTSFVGQSAIERIAELRTIVEDRVKDPELAQAPILIVLDDGDELIEGIPTPHLEVIVKSARDANVYLIAAMSTFRATRAFCVWVPFMRSNRQGILLQPGEDEGEIFNARLPKRTGLQTPPGRGYLFTRGAPQLVQVAIDER